MWTEGDCKACENNGCSNIIYRYQCRMQGKVYVAERYCDSQCVWEAQGIKLSSTVRNKSLKLKLA